MNVNVSDLIVVRLVQEHMVNALANRAEEGRGRLR